MSQAELPTRLEVVSNSTKVGENYSYVYVVRDNCTGKEFIVGLAKDSIAICPIDQIK